MCDTTSYVWHDSFIDCILSATWLIHVCDMFIHMCDTTPPYVWHDVICMTWLIHRLHVVCDVTHPRVRHAHSCVRHWTHSYVLICHTDSFIWDHMSYSVSDIWTHINEYIYELIVWMSPMSHVFICPILMTPHSCVWHDSFICATCPFMCVTFDSFTCVHMSDTPHSYAWHAHSYVRHMTLSYVRHWWCLIHMCDMVHPNVRHASFCDIWLIHISPCATCLIHTCAMTHSYVLHWHNFSTCVTSSFIFATWHNSNVRHVCLRGNRDSENYDPKQSMNELMNYRINESTSICDNGIVFKGRTHDPTHSLRSPQAESRTVTFLCQLRVLLFVTLWLCRVTNRKLPSTSGARRWLWNKGLRWKKALVRKKALV